jgi:phage anti-repressor protein
MTIVNLMKLLDKILDKNIESLISTNDFLKSQEELVKNYKELVRVKERYKTYFLKKHEDYIKEFGQNEIQQIRNIINYHNQ